jgi:hypothetical protein
LCSTDGALQCATAFTGSNPFAARSSSYESFIVDGLQYDIAIGGELVEWLVSPLLSLFSDSSSGGMGAERGRCNGNWEAGERKAGGIDWNRIGGKDKGDDDPDPPLLKSYTS